MSKTIETIFRNPQKPRCREGIAEECCMLSILLAVSSCFNIFWHGLIPTSYFIFNDFYTCSTHFFHKYSQDTVGSLASAVRDQSRGIARAQSAGRMRCSEVAHAPYAQNGD